MITIIVPVYGVEEYIEECLASVAAQTYGGPMECIVVDDCSPDASMDIARRFVDAYRGPIEFRLLRRERNGGLSEARNTGLDAARGSWVFFLDSDDTLPPDAMFRLADAARGIPCAQIVVGDIRIFGCRDHGKPDITKAPLSGACRPAAARRMLLDYNSIWHTAWCKLISRSLLCDSSVRFRSGMLSEDIEWFFRLALSANGVGVCRAEVYNYRMRPTSIMNDTDKSSRRRADVLLSFLRCAHLAGGVALGAQVRWILYHIIDLDSAVRWEAGDGGVTSDRRLAVLAATVRRLRRKMRPWRGPALWTSLALLDAELSGGVRMSDALYFPLHRASKMFFKLSGIWSRFR